MSCTDLGVSRGGKTSEILAVDSDFQIHEVWRAKCPGDDALESVWGSATNAEITQQL
jgi:hypothetical protein